MQVTAGLLECILFATITRKNVARELACSHGIQQHDRRLMCIRCKQGEQRARCLNHFSVGYLQYIIYFHKVKQGLQISRISWNAPIPQFYVLYGLLIKGRYILLAVTTWISVAWLISYTPSPL